MPERMSNRMSGVIPDRMPESPSEYRIHIIFWMPGDMSETMSEWLVKVGITRSKVIDFKVVRSPCVLNAMSRTIAILLLWRRLFSFLNTCHWIVQGRWMKTSTPWHAQNSVKKKKYVLSQPCLHQLVKGRLLPQDGSESFGVPHLPRKMTSLSNVRAPHARESALRRTPNRAGATSVCGAPFQTLPWLSIP